MHVQLAAAEPGVAARKLLRAACSRCREHVHGGGDIVCMDCLSSMLAKHGSPRTACSAHPTKHSLHSPALHRPALHSAACSAQLAQHCLAKPKHSLLSAPNKAQPAQPSLAQTSLAQHSLLSTACTALPCQAQARPAMYGPTVHGLPLSPDQASPANAMLSTRHRRLDPSSPPLL